MSKLHSLDLVGKKYNESRETVRRYIRLTYLIPELLKLCDDTENHDKRTYLTLGITNAVELSYLSIEEQKVVQFIIEYEEITPSLGQARAIRKLSEKKKFKYEEVEKIMLAKKGNQNEQISFNKSKIEEALPFDLVKRDKRYIEAYIVRAIIEYKKNQKNNKNFNDIDL